MRAKITNIITGVSVEVHDSTTHPDCHYGKAVWVDDDNVAYFEVGGKMPASYTIVVYDVGLETRIDIGRRIRQLRTDQGMTQTQLAFKVGIKQPHLARIERGTSAVRLDLIANIADSLGKRIDLV